MTVKLFRTKANSFLLNPTVLICIFMTFIFLQILWAEGGGLILLLITLIVLWSTKWDWPYFGISTPYSRNMVMVAIFYAIGLFIIMDIALIPIIEMRFGETDLSDFDDLQGDIVVFLIFSLFMWFTAAFGEELVYRGFFIKRIAIMLGDNQGSWVIAAFINSFVFGLGHIYMGMSGALQAGLAGLLLSFVFIYNKQNLMMCMLMHGFYDMIWATILYLDKVQAVKALILETFH